MHYLCCMELTNTNTFQTACRSIVISKLMVRLRMGRDDWKYDEDALDEMADEEKKASPPPEKQCPQCLHWIDREALYCPWCGKAVGEKDRKR